jgi:hypothetical protein
MAAWLAAALPFARRPGPMARTNHGMAASAKYTGSTTLTAGTAAGVAGWEMAGMAVRAAPAGAKRISACMAVIIQIMAPAISS